MADAIDQCEAIQFKIGDVTSLIILLSSPDPLICAASLDGLTKYADQGPKQKQYLYSTGIIKTLIELSKDKKVRKSSVCLLSSLTELSHPDMQRKDLLQQLIAILNKEDQPEIIDEAAYCIANISQDFGLKAEIRKSGGIQILVKLLDNPDPDVKKNCALALLSCIEDFTNRAEMRHAKGLRPLLDLLLSEHQEVQELALKCLLKCSEDHSNVVELRKQSAIRKLLDFVTIEANEPQFQQALQCLLFQIEDAESVQTFVECNGLAPLMKLTSHDDVPIRKQASFCLAKALLFEKNQVAARDFGLIPTIVQQVNAIDVNACAAACTVIGALAKNDHNQGELVKAGVIEVILKHIQSEDKELRRQGISALKYFCNSAKNRSKIHAIADGVSSMVKLLSSDDGQTVIHTCDCLTAFCEDLSSRQDVTKAGAVTTLVAILDNTDTKVQAASCVTLARLLQESDGQAALGKQAKVFITKLVEFLQSTDMNLCKVATYLLSIACQVEANAVHACSIGAVEILIQLSKQPAKKATKFSLEGLEKLLNYRIHITAKYWLTNHLTSTNLIQDGFYDLGYAGINFEKIGPLPTITDLQSRPVDKKRETLLIDFASDSTLSSVLSVLSDLLPTMSPEQQIKAIALAVSKIMGGPISESQLSDFHFTFRVSELKIAQGSNVIPIGQINKGTFYHRALLFKALCDRLGLRPCSLARGEYNRAWNVIDVKSQSLLPKAIIKNSRPTTSRRKSQQNLAPTGPVVSITEQKQMYLGCVEVEAEPFQFDEPAIVDLMFEPGRLLRIDSPEAERYKRCEFQ